MSWALGKMTKAPVLAEVTFLQWETNHNMSTAEPGTLRLCYAIARGAEGFGWDGAAYEGRKGPSEEMTLGYSPRDARHRCAQSPGRVPGLGDGEGKVSRPGQCEVRSGVCGGAERRERYMGTDLDSYLYVTAGSVNFILNAMGN